MTANKDEKLQKIKRNIAKDKSPGFTEDDQCVLWYKRRICISNNKEITNSYSEKLIIRHTSFTPEEIKCIKISSFPTGGTVRSTTLLRT
jgi:hypothetical protein